MAASGSSHCWSATLVVFLVLLDLTTGQCEHVFLEQPDPVVEPLGTQVEVSCAVNSTFRTTWNILLPGRELGLATDTLSNIDLAANRGFVTNISSTENREPPLRINGAIGNSGTTVQCRATNLMDGFLRCPGRNFLVTFFGPPLAPENLTATADGLGSLQITWSQDNVVSVEFVVNATNVADSSEAIVMRTSQLNSVISFSDNTSCNNYSIQVVANNSAGQGPPSDVIIRSVPSLPEISAVKESLQHTLRRTSSGITLDVTLNAVNSCPEYPVFNYTLVVVDSEGNRATQTSQATRDIVSIAISDLRENTRYSYYVIAANQFGNSNSSTPVEIMTTDVQNVTICLVGGSTFTINCVFLEGSNTNCIYSLRAGVDISNINRTIERSNSEGDTIMVANIDGSQLLAYASDLMDVGDDLAVRRNITEDSVLPCPVSTTDLHTSPTTATVATTSSPVPVGLILGVSLTLLMFLVLIVAVIILVAYCYKKGSRGTFRVKKMQGNHSDGGDKGALRLECSSLPMTDLVVDVESVPLKSAPFNDPAPSNEVSSDPTHSSETTPSIPQPPLSSSPTVGPLTPNNPDTAAAAALASGHYEKGPDAGEVGLGAGMYDRIGSRTGKEREAHPLSQLQDEATYSKLNQGQEPLYSSPADAVSSTPTATKKHPKQVSSKRGSNPTAIAPAPQQQQDLDHSTKERASKAATGSGSVDDSVMEDAYSIPWRGNKSLHKQQSKDGQQSRGTDSRHQANDDHDHVHEVDQSTTESQEQHIYQELETPVEKKKKKKMKKSPDLVVRIISDPDPREPPPIPPFCPAGGDSPGKKTDPLPASPELPLPAGEYAEITSRGVSL